MTPPANRLLSMSVLAAVIAVWIGLLVLPPVLLMRGREAWLATLERPEAQTRWDEFREAMRAQTGRDGPVQRKVPKSPEPPLRVWLRDYVGLAIAAWLALGGTLGLFCVILVAGALGVRTIPVSSTKDQPRGGGHDEKQHDGDTENAEKRGHGADLHGRDGDRPTAADGTQSPGSPQG